MMTHSPQRGFTLLIAVVLTSVLLSVGFALLDIAYKQTVLSSTARSSQGAFYAADSAMECALYWDQQHNAFSAASALGSIRCSGFDIAVTVDSPAGIRTSSFSIPCPGSGTQAVVEVQKGGVCSGSATSCLYARGYNNCNAADPRRVERALKVTY